MKLRNFWMVVSFCVFLLGPTSLYFSRAVLNLNVPASMVSEEASYLAGGKVDVDFAGSFSMQGIATRQLQANVEQLMDNNVPNKAFALLSNAGLQIHAISYSNCLFQFDLYPTYYGSTYYFLPKNASILRAPTPETSKDYTHLFEGFSKDLSEVAKKYTDISFVVFIADISSFSSFNPARSLISQKTTTTENCVEIIRASSDAPNLTILTNAFDNVESYYQNYYKTDHHWSGYGAMQAYRLMSESAPLVALKDMDSINSVAFPGHLVMNGSSSRSGLLLLNEPLKEPKFDFTAVKPSGGYEASVIEANFSNSIAADPLRTEFDFYHTWYGPSRSVVLTNQEKENSSALLIGDSFTSAIQWLIASNYRETHVYLDAHGGYKGNESLYERIEDADCDTVFFVMAPSGINFLMTCYPNYFTFSG